ncbi:MAG: hypothetical protein D6160_14705 [Ketobacter sp.]|nr:MAG: hypothetical protein D6160_14705 [Ketobacter sp.]
MMFRIVRIVSFWIFLPLLFLPLGRCSLDPEINQGLRSFSYQVQGIQPEFQLEEFKDFTIHIITFSDAPFHYDLIGWGIFVTLWITFFGVNLPVYLAWLKPLAWLSIPLMFLVHSIYTAALVEAQTVTLYGHLFIYVGYLYGIATFNAYLPASVRLR